MGTIRVAASAGEVAAHFVLEANVVTSVIFEADLDLVEVVSRDGAGEVWYTVDGATPAVGSKFSYVLPNGAVGSDERPTGVGGPTVIRLLSTGTPALSVQQVA